jgi:predicted RNA binding protein YcfA (HicA-like mRNA interferase family)
MPDYPKLTAKEAERLLMQHGFILERQKGSHRIYTKYNYRMVLPHHTGNILHPKIIKQLFDIVAETK